MKITSQLATASPNAPNLTFAFDDTVDQYVLGASEIYYTFGSNDHHIKKIKLNMAPSNSGSTVSATISMTLSDDSGNDISSSSYVNVACLAALGQNTYSNVQMTSNLAFGSGESSSPITLDNTTYINEAIMEGFELAYNEDHHLKRIYANVSVSVQQGKSATVTGSDDMYDDSGNSATTKNLQAAYLGTYINGSDSGLVAIEQSYDTGAGLQNVDLSTYLGGKTLTGAAVILKSYDLSFSGDHHMKYLKVGADTVAFDGSTVSFTPMAEMKDDSSHSASGSVTLIIIGTCDPN
ncbi:MAG TPA: hypothetical protein ENJ41_05180 [Oceanospirillales bacterium]|nr:hypothetical protein [Oceanospirillales bacterium]